MITDYSKIVDLDNWPPKPEGQKEPEIKTDNDIPDWAKPIVETISKTEQLVKDMTDKRSEPESKSLISEADFQEYLKNKI